MFWELISQYQEKNTTKARQRTHSEPIQTSTMNLFAKLVNVTISGESSILDAWLGSDDASAMFQFSL